MSLFYRPITTYPVRCGPSLLARPVYPMLNDFASVFSALDDSVQLLDQIQRQAQKQRPRLYSPKFNVKETKNSYSVEGELPGLDANQVKIEFTDDGHTLQISGTIDNQNSKPTPQPISPSAVEEPSSQSGAASDASSRTLQATVEDATEETELPADTAALQSSSTEPVVAESPVAPVQQKSTPQPQPVNHHKSLVNERYTGSFQRSFQFPSKIDQEAVKASLKNGILSITLPFARRPASRTIQIE